MGLNGIANRHPSNGRITLPYPKDDEENWYRALARDVICTSFGFLQYAHLLRSTLFNLGKKVNTYILIIHTIGMMLILTKTQKWIPE